MKHAEHQDDCDLLRRYRDSGDCQAFETLVHRHVDLVYGTAYRELRHTQDAEDVSQRVFTTLAKNGRRTSILNAPGWLFTCTRQEVKRMMRDEGRRRIRETKAAELASVLGQEATMPSLISEDGVAPVLQEALDRLPDGDQEVLFLRFHQELNFEQIGEALSIHQRAAQKRVYRAMDRLRKDLAKRGITASAAVFTGQLYTAGATPAPAGLASALSKTALVEAAQLPIWTSTLAWLSKPLLILGGASLVVTSVVGVAQWRSNSETVKVPQTLTRSTEPIDSTKRSRSDSIRRLAVDDIEGIYQLDKSDRDRALVRLTRHLEDVNDEPYLTDLFKRWTLLDAKRCVEAIDALIQNQNNQVGRDSMLTQGLTIPMSTWYQQDQAALVQWLKERPRVNRSERFVMRAGLQVLGRHDQAMAFAYLSARGGTGDEAYALLAELVCQQPMEGACRFLANLPDSDVVSAELDRAPETTFTDSDQTPRTRLLNASLPLLYDKDRQAVADWIVSLPSNPAADLFTGTFVSLWAEQEPERAAAWVLELESSTREAVLPALAESWSRESPSEALDWLLESSLAETTWEMATPAFQVWLGEEDLSEPQAWLARHSSNPRAAGLFALFSDALEPVEALDWASQLEEGFSRSCAQANALFRLARQDPELAKKQASNLVTAEAVAKGLFAGEGRRALIKWRQELEAEGEWGLVSATHAAEVGIIAAYDPSMVSEQVLALAEGEGRDLALDVLIERAHQRSMEGFEQSREWAAAFRDHSLRRQWETRLDQVAQSKPWETPKQLLPSLKEGFKAQTLSNFDQRLDLMASMAKVRRGK